jgi:uncharacterized protein with HEPN domain
MDNTKNDRYYLDKIITDLEFVVAHTAGKSKDEIAADELLLDSIMFRIIQIAENNSRLSDGFKEEHREVPWFAVKGMRNIIVHDYGYVDLTIVYDTVTNGIPDMLRQLKKIKTSSDVQMNQ